MTALPPSSPLAPVSVGKYPAALVINLARDFQPDYVIGKIREFLEATRWSNDTLMPDFRARCDGVKLLLAYGIGLPVQRAEIVIKEPPKEDMMEKLVHSEHARKALKNMWERPEAKAQLAQNQQDAESASRA